MKVIVDTSKLKLPGLGAFTAWERPLPVSSPGLQAACNELAEVGLTAADVQTLVARLTHESTSSSITDAWPTVGEDRAVLAAAQSLAGALAHILRNASPKAQAEFATAALQSALDAALPNRWAGQLQAFASGVERRIGAMPKQARARPATWIVRVVASVVGDKLGAVTKYPGSKFHRACVAAFALAGRAGSPDRAIEAFLEKSERQPTKKGHQ